MRLVGGYDQEVAAWASERFGRPIIGPFSAFGVLNNRNELCGAAIFGDFYKGGNIELTYYGPGTAARGIIRDLCRYAFNQCGVSRVTAKTMRANAVCQHLLPKLGFHFEGIQKRYYGTDKSSDALTFVLFRKDAKRWLGA